MNKYLVAYAEMKPDIYSNYNIIHNDIVEFDCLSEDNLRKYMFGEIGNPKRIINIIKLDK